MKMKKVLYFAYGSNMLMARLKERLYGKVTNCGTYTLKGWKLVFNAKSQWDDITFANIVESPNDSVEGVLYELSYSQFTTLDRFEQLYERQMFDIDKNTLGCTYICVDDCYINDKFLPERYYLSYLINGCIENSLLKTLDELLDIKMKLEL